MPRLTPRFATFLALSGFALLGAFLILKATPEGLGLSDDSIAYIAGARSVLAGDGYREAWLASNEPVTHFPPIFSGALALIGLAEMDPLNAARYLNALLFGLNAALLGLLGWRATKSAWSGIFLSTLFVFNESLFRVHAVAMSEPLFIFFSLLAFLSFDIWVAAAKVATTTAKSAFADSSPADEGRLRKGWLDFSRPALWLAATGLLTSLAYLTRYSGLALVATFIVALFFINKTWRARFSSAIIFLAGYIPPVLAWSIRNEIVAGNATNRSMIWHPVTAEKLLLGLHTFAEFLVPVDEWRSALLKTPAILIGVMILIALSLLIWLIKQGLAFALTPNPFATAHFSAPAGRGESIAFTNTLYIFGYLGAVLFSISLFDASTPLKARILAPVYVSLLFTLTFASAWAWTYRPLARVTLSALMVFIFSVSAVGAGRSVSELSRGGVGYASFQWYDSEIMAALRNLPTDIVIYTNEPGAVYLYTGRGCRTLPSRVDPVTGVAWENYAEAVNAMRANILAGRAVLVIFNFESPELAADYKVMASDLHVDQKSSGDILLSAP